jgi:hypothetical protein
VSEGIGDWTHDEAPTSGSAPAAASAATGSAAIASVDLQALVREAALAVMRTRMEQIAAVAVDAVLDGSMRDQLREAADDAARLALSAPAALDVGEPPPELYYPDVAAFVTEQLVPMYRRPLGGQHVTWCPEWWKHAEAIARLEALWRAWEHLRLDPATGMSVWFRDHADHHMAVLLSADGPFKGCKPKEGHGDRLEAFPLTPPPAELFAAS